MTDHTLGTGVNDIETIRNMRSTWATTNPAFDRIIGRLLARIDYLTEIRRAYVEEIDRTADSYEAHRAQNAASRERPTRGSEKPPRRRGLTWHAELPATAPTSFRQEAIDALVSALDLTLAPTERTLRT